MSDASLVALEQAIRFESDGRDYYEQTQSLPTMHRMVMELGRRGSHFRDRKAYEKHIYRLFPSDPVRRICKLAGLPMPQPDT